MAEQQLLFSQQDDDLTVRIWQQGDRRWLDFDDVVVQSEILLDRPDHLLLANRHMLAGCLFSPPPKNILLAGAGGGAIALYFSNRFPDVSVDAVELSPLICELARDFFDFPDGEQWLLHSQDINHYVAECQQHYDAIVIDIAEDKLTPEWIIDNKFLHRCRKLLTPQGHVAFNLLVNDGEGLMHFLSAIRESFNRQTVCLSVAEHRNIIVLAFNNKPREQVSAEHLIAIEQEWGIEFTVFYQQMLKENPKASGVI